jgi:hypothetical protein
MVCIVLLQQAGLACSETVTAVQQIFKEFVSDMMHFRILKK